ncbi:sensor histidine kinase [Paenibacillus sp. IITD108]|uniref:sensor histidine kinase n=1 Tax=Paenibacillus sp. IITD108 TaxID=3116649 RepID=UPI002F423FB5
MSIRLKLYMSYLAMTFVPVILMLCLFLTVFYIVGKHDLRELSENQQIERFEQALVYGELTYVIEHDTGKLEDKAYLDELQQELAEVWAGLVVIRNGQIADVSSFLQDISPNENWSAYIEQLPEELSFKLYRFGTHNIQFQYPDGSNGQMILFRRIDPIPIFWHPLVLAALLGFITLTSFLLTYYVSRSIIKPIQSLKTAALRIKDGDLSYQLLDSTNCKNFASGVNEIEQLSIAFEEMRVRLKSSIDQSLQYEENRKQLLSHISHDLKTPISAIKGYIEGILDGIANTDEMRERYLQTIYRKAAHMDQLIDELFLFSKLDLHTVAFDFKPVELVRYLDHFMEEQQFELEKSDIALSFSSENIDQLMISADLEKLNRVLNNILNNCVKYLEFDDNNLPHRVQVRLKQDEHFAVIEIEDNGPGITEDDLPFIFDRFYRAEKSRNSETGGSGLGLAIVKQIVEGHNGMVTARNARQGAIFTIKLPKMEPAKVVKMNAAYSDH